MRYKELIKPQELTAWEMIETFADATADIADMHHAPQWKLYDIGMDGITLAGMAEGDTRYWFARSHGTCFVGGGALWVYVNEYHPPQVLRVTCSRVDAIGDLYFTAMIMDTAQALAECPPSA